MSSPPPPGAGRCGAPRHGPELPQHLAGLTEPALLEAKDGRYLDLLAVEARTLVDLQDPSRPIAHPLLINNQMNGGADRSRMARLGRSLPDMSTMVSIRRAPEPDPRSARRSWSHRAPCSSPAACRAPRRPGIPR